MLALQQCIKLARFREAWDFCKHLNNLETWHMMGKAALRCLNVDFGKWAVQHVVYFKYQSPYHNLYDPLLPHLLHLHGFICLLCDHHLQQHHHGIR